MIISSPPKINRDNIKQIKNSIVKLKLSVNSSFIFIGILLILFYFVQLDLKKNNFLRYLNGIKDEGKLFFLKPPYTKNYNNLFNTLKENRENVPSISHKVFFKPLLILYEILSIVFILLFYRSLIRNYSLFTSLFFTLIPLIIIVFSVFFATSFKRIIFQTISVKIRKTNSDFLPAKKRSIENLIILYRDIMKTIINQMTTPVSLIIKGLKNNLEIPQDSGGPKLTPKQIQEEKMKLTVTEAKDKIRKHYDDYSSSDKILILDNPTIIASNKLFELIINIEEDRDTLKKRIDKITEEEAKICLKVLISLAVYLEAYLKKEKKDYIFNYQRGNSAVLIKYLDLINILHQEGNKDIPISNFVNSLELSGDLKKIENLEKMNIIKKCFFYFSPSFKMSTEELFDLYLKMVAVNIYEEKNLNIKKIK